MVDFKKKIKGMAIAKSIHPIEIYDKADRQSTAGPLRPVQVSVLEEWFDNRKNDKDVIIKLHTGEGKTLIGLLILQSRLNQGCGPCLYVCPSKQLAKQVSEDALKFGIRHILDAGGSELPLDFTESKAIFITYVHRVFNGRTKFGLDNKHINIGTIVLDDSHACIEAIRNSFSISIKRSSETFRYFLSMFESSLRQQGEGTFLDIEGKEYSQDVMPVPYWDWIEKKDAIAKYFFDHQEDDEIRFTYPLLKDIWGHCTAYFTASGIEITPDYNLIHRFIFFTNCSQRILMSATTQDDSYFIKGLGFSRESVCNPLINEKSKWSGEKMILFPSRVDETLSPGYMRQWICNALKGEQYKSVVLVPSFWYANEYEHRGAGIAINNKLESELEYLQSSLINDHTVVFVNRYDGIDLPDNQCRVLMIDSLPTLGNLSDRYELSCRENSNIIVTKLAQKIEQGLGRSVRSEKDYSVILIVGEDLVRFVKTSSNQTYFSSQTRQQIQIGEDVTDSVKSEMGSEEPIIALRQVINQCLNRDDDWKQYYQESMDNIIPILDNHPLIDIIQKENEAENAYRQSDYNVAMSKYREIANSMNNDLDRGWYLQLAAKCEFHISKIDSIKIQESAHRNNSYVLFPNTIRYKAKDITNLSALRIARDYFRKTKTYNDLHLKINSILANLSFGIPSNKFERSMMEIGSLLGFASERPDQTYKVGPDNLWIYPNTRKYFVIECKNEVLATRNTINKEEVGQMNNHIGWFEEIYGNDTDVEYIQVHPTNIYSEKANYAKKVRVMTPEKVEQLKQNITSYIKEFAKYDLSTIDEQIIAEALKQHHLSIDEFCNCYTVESISKNR